MAQSGSVFSSEQLAKITANWNLEDDTCSETTLSDPSRYMLVGFPYPNMSRRSLPVGVATRAMTYIRALVEQYPFQLRYLMGEPLWLRFCEEWDSSGDSAKSLKAI